MKPFKHIFQITQVAIVAGLVVFASCSKDRIQPSLNKYSSMDSYFASKQQKEQDFTIDTTGPGPITGNQGTSIWPAKNVLMYQHGDTNVYFPFTLRLVELYTPKDMIYYQLPSVSGGNVITTAGEVRVTATKGDSILVLRPKKSWQVEMPNANPQSGMSVYYGNQLASYLDWVSSTGQFTANQNYKYVTTAAPHDSVATKGYIGQIDTLGWISCAKSIDLTANSTFKFTSTTDDLTNVSIFMYLPSRKSLMQVYKQTSGLLPVGDSVKIIIMGMSGNDIYCYYLATTVASSATTLPVSLAKITDADLTTRLNGL